VEGNKQIAMRVLKGAFIDRDPSADLHPAQSIHPKRSGADPGPDREPEQGFLLRTGHGGRRRRSRHGAWPLRRVGTEADDRRRHLPSGRRKSRRALGRHAGGSAGVSHRERQPDVRATGRKVGSPRSNSGRESNQRRAPTQALPAAVGSTRASTQDQRRWGWVLGIRPLRICSHAAPFTWMAGSSPAMTKTRCNIFPKTEGCDISFYSADRTGRHARRATFETQGHGGRFFYLDSL
jgi:hypothetical protein